MDIEKLFELLDDKEKEEMFGCAATWRQERMLETHTDLKQWAAKHLRMNIRLTRCLLIGCNNGLFKEVEAVDKIEFMKIRDAGLKIWLEFVFIRDADIEIVMRKVTDGIND